MRSEGQRETGNLTLNLVVAGEIFCNLPLPLGLQEEYIQREPQEERGRAYHGKSLRPPPKSVWKHTRLF